MPVTSVTVIRGVESEVSSSSKTATKAYYVQTDDDDDGPEVIEVAAGLPAMFISFLPNDPSRKLRKRRCAQSQENSRLWIVTDTYERPASESNDKDTAPWEREPESAWDFQETREPVYVDAAGRPLVNTAGQTFDPPIEFDIVDPVLTYTRNDQEFDPALAVEYRNAANEDEFYGNPPMTAKIKGISARRVYEAEWGFYWTVTIIIVFREWNPDKGLYGWQRKIVNEGRYQLDSNGLLAPILDAAGAAVNDPVRLDEDGVPIDPKEEAFPGELTHFITIDPKLKPFDILNLE